MSRNSFKLLEHASNKMLKDSRGRIAKKVRISVTDRCNFTCLFCMPNRHEVKWFPKRDILSFEEITRIVRILASEGVEKARITGGEPLVRMEVEKLVSQVTAVDGIKEVDMTTNGFFLKEKAKLLKSAGLKGVTVSLHSLRRERFAEISGMDALPRVLEGIEEALNVGLSPVKINTVAIRGYNDDEVIEIVDFARERNISVRFIEFMPLDGLGKWSSERLVSGREIVSIVGRKYQLIPQGREVGATANLYRFADGKGELGLITPMTEPFCDDCDRMRLTADGKLLTCLFDTKYFDLKELLRGGASDDQIADYIRSCVYMKIPGVAYMPWVKQSWDRPRAMNAIGG